MVCGKNMRHLHERDWNECAWISLLHIMLRFVPVMYLIPWQNTFWTYKIYINDPDDRHRYHLSIVTPFKHHNDPFKAMQMFFEKIMLLNNTHCAGSVQDGENEAEVALNGRRRWALEQLSGICSLPNSTSNNHIAVTDYLLTHGFFKTEKVGKFYLARKDIHALHIYHPS